MRIRQSEKKLSECYTDLQQNEKCIVLILLFFLFFCLYFWWFQIRSLAHPREIAPPRANKFQGSKWLAYECAFQVQTNLSRNHTPNDLSLRLLSSWLLSTCQNHPRDRCQQLGTTFSEPDEIIGKSQHYTCLLCLTHSLPQIPHWRLSPTFFTCTPSAYLLTLVLRLLGPAPVWHALASWELWVQTTFSMAIVFWSVDLIILDNKMYILKYIPKLLSYLHS